MDASIVAAVSSQALSPSEPCLARTRRSLSQEQALLDAEDDEMAHAGAHIGGRCVCFAVVANAPLMAGCACIVRLTWGVCPDACMTSGHCSPDHLRR